MESSFMHLITLAVLYIYLVEAYLKEPCKDEISTSTCWYFRKRGFCKKSREKLKSVCDKTCGFCNSCEDSYVKSKCLQLKVLGGCLTNPGKMKHICPDTCGFCPKVCNDVYAGCQHLSHHRACYEFRHRMEKLCPATCGFCNPTTPCDEHDCPIGFRCQLDSNWQPFCECEVRCDATTMFGPVCAKNGITYPHLCDLKKDECKKLTFIPVDFFGDCNAPTVGCKDESRESKAGLCVKWKQIGACRDHVALMDIYCKRTCGYCRVPGNPPKPKCLQSEHGCCWNDEKVAKEDKYGKGCAPCVDLKLCKYFKMYCNSKLSHEFMKERCPLTCGYCIPEYIQRLQEKQWVIERKRRHLQYYPFKVKKVASINKSKSNKKIV